MTAPFATLFGDSYPKVRPSESSEPANTVYRSLGISIRSAEVELGGTASKAVDAQAFAAMTLDLLLARGLGIDSGFGWDDVCDVELPLQSFLTDGESIGLGLARAICSRGAERAEAGLHAIANEGSDWRSWRTALVG